MRYRFVESMEKYEVCFTGIYRQLIANTPPVEFIKFTYNIKSESVYVWVVHK